MPLKSLSFKFFLFLTSTLLSLFLLESIFRLPIIREKTGGNNPDVNHWLDQVKVKEINSLGFRDREYSTEKPLDTFRILILGDSFVYGWMVDYEKIFAEVLEKSLNIDVEKKIEVINMGLPGWNTPEQLEALQSNGLTFQPDLVIVAFVLNDPMVALKDEPIGEERQDSELSLLPNDEWDRFLNHHSYFYSFVRFRFNRSSEQNGKKADYFTWQRKLYNNNLRGWKNFQQALGNIKGICEQNNIKLILVSLNFLPDWEKEVAMVFNEAGELSIPVFDVFPYFSGYKLDELISVNTDGHPNVLAHSIYARAIGEYLKLELE